MEILPPITSWAFPATALLVLTLLWLRLRQRHSGARGPGEALDTVAAWPPQAVRVLTVSERDELLRRAMPGFLVLAQVPLSRFIRVPTRNSYTDWVQRVGLLNADLLLCDAGSRVLAVIDIRVPDESARARRRHERMVRVLETAGIPVMTWHDGNLPSLAEARALLAPLAGAAAPGMRGTASRPMPLGPEPSLAKILAAGDRRAAERAAESAADANEPVPSAFFEELETEPAPRRR